MRGVLWNEYSNLSLTILKPVFSLLTHFLPKLIFSCFKIMYNAITLTCKKKKKLAKQKIRNKFTLSKLKKKKGKNMRREGLLPCI